MQILKSITVFLLTFLGVIIFFELFLSLCGILQPIVRIDPEKGERYRPNITCSSPFVAEGFGLAKTNSAGWFGHDFNDTGADDISVAVIGNSFVASRQVFYRQNFMSLTEKKTNEILSYKRIPKNVSLFNFGKEDLPLNELLYVKEDLHSINNPDYFLILLNEGTFNAGRERYVAHYEWVNGKFELDTSFRKSSFVKNYHTFEFFTKSSVLFLAHRVKSHLPKAGKILFDKFYIEPENAVQEEEHTNLTANIDEEQNAFIKELSKDKRVIFLLNLNPELAEQVKSVIGSSSYIDIQPVLAAAKARGTDPNYWEIPDKVGHFNLFGHKLIAEEITKKMLAIAIKGR